MNHPFFAPWQGRGTLTDNPVTVGWRSHPNIALVKYWGKRGDQFPVNPSLSMSLARASTHTIVMAGTGAPGLVSVNGDPQHPFVGKMRYLLDRLGAEIPVLRDVSLDVKTENTFPHSTGIASSASGLSAFALCLLDLASNLLHIQVADSPFYRAASLASRLGSGSACRSVYGGFVSWGKNDLLEDSSDELAMPLPVVHPQMANLADAILVISHKPKSLSSTAGHGAMADHPFLEGRIRQADSHFRAVAGALANGDFEQLAVVSEREALSLHALMMSAGPATLLLQPGTVEAIHRIRRARAGGVPVFFTLDAGANVHVLYPADSEVSSTFIADELQPLCEEGHVIFDHSGPGPSRLDLPFVQA